MESVRVNTELDQMRKFVGAGPALYQASPFWTDLGGVHFQQLEAAGVENFKRTVNMQYFNWGTLGILRHQIVRLAMRWTTQPSMDVFEAEFPNASPFNALQAWIYKTFVALYADALRGHDGMNLLKTLDEPDLGNPYKVRHRGHVVTQDFCNSVHELYSIMGPAPDRERAFSVGEIGAGYGRLAYVFLKTFPNASYTIIDIPPALYLSQNYLTSLFLGEKIFGFRPFTRFEDVSEEFEASRIRFLAAPQIELLPGKVFDYFVNISSLHEMTVAQVKNYFGHMDRLCRGRVYNQAVASLAGDDQRQRVPREGLPDSARLAARLPPAP